MSNERNGVVVSHPTKQGNIYERPFAAQQAGLPVRFLTGFYDATVPRWMESAFGLTAGTRRQLAALRRKRTHAGLAPSAVVSVSHPLIEMAKLRFGGLNAWQNERHDRACARWLARAAEADRYRVFHGFQEACTRSLRVARERGIVTAVEVTSPPIEDSEIENMGPVSAEFRREMAAENRRKQQQILAEAALADKVIVQSAFSGDWLVRAGIPAARIVQVDLGVDTDAFHPAPTEAAAVSAPLRLLFVGQIGYRKGIDLLSAALHQVDRAQLQVVAAGHVVDEVGRAAVAANPWLDYRGVVDDGTLRRLYLEADVLVIPSRSEGGCNVVMEALASGCPCLVSRGAISVIEDGQDGWIVPNGDAHALAGVVRRLLADRSLVRRARGAARRKAERHSWAQFHRRLGSFYRDLK